MVKALVYDIHDGACPLPDRIAIDTNAWLSYAYAPQRPNALDYNNFIGRLLNASKELLRSALLFPEMAHVIEGEELKAYNAANNKNYCRKDGRDVLKLRRIVSASVVATWRAVENASVSTPGIMVDEALATRALARFGRQKLDGYDLYVVEEVEALKVPILTDDGDYLSVPGLKVFTASPRAIAAAQSEDRIRTAL